ncbi:MAG: tripartite tricarboxylate transporter substrate binding protein [Proteobacteria bacterium]|nr:tripartite tricarboxylate transporter substrate binding protein [Pseudomonadota bacterium]
MFRVLAVFATAWGIAFSAQAQTYPNKVVRLVVPFAPGGSSEIIARTLAHRLSENLGQQFIVENKPGGGGNIAMQEVARAEPDGYTLMLGHVGSLAMNPPMFANNPAMKKPPYDANKDFIPVSLVAVVPNIFVVNAGVPAKDLKEFVALARAKPGTINYGSAGNGSAGHLAFEYLKMVTGIDIVHVPYKGTGPMLTDLIAGQTQATSAGTPPLMPHVKSGKLRAIAVGTPQRIAALPDVGTVAQQGYPGFETSQWYGIIVPAKTPDGIVKKLADEIAKATKSAEVTERFRIDGTIAVGSTPSEFAEFILKEQARWGEVVRKSGVKVE